MTRMLGAQDSSRVTRHRRSKLWLRISSTVQTLCGTGLCSTQTHQSLFMRFVRRESSRPVPNNSFKPSPFRCLVQVLIILTNSRPRAVSRRGPIWAFEFSLWFDAVRLSPLRHAPVVPSSRLTRVSRPNPTTPASSLFAQPCTPPDCS